MLPLVSIPSRRSFGNKPGAPLEVAKTTGADACFFH